MKIQLVGLAMVMCATVSIGVLATWSAERDDAWQAERARPSIHNDATKCRAHCRNAGLRVTSWDGAYPSARTQHGCRCGE